MESDNNSIIKRHAQWAINKLAHDCFCWRIKEDCVYQQTPIKLQNKSQVKSHYERNCIEGCNYETQQIQMQNVEDLREYEEYIKNKDHVDQIELQEKLLSQYQNEALLNDTKVDTFEFQILEKGNKWLLGQHKITTKPIKDEQAYSQKTTRSKITSTLLLQLGAYELSKLMAQEFKK